MSWVGLGKPKDNWPTSTRPHLNFLLSLSHSLTYTPMLIFNLSWRILSLFHSLPLLAWFSYKIRNLYLLQPPPSKTMAASVPFHSLLFHLLLLLLLSGAIYSSSEYLIGVGTYDITGPAADVNMMGYANADQIASGIHFRLRARAFIVAEPQGNRVVFVNLDACMASQIVTIKVLERLKARYTDEFNLNLVYIL